MRVRQSAYFLIRTATVPLADITAALGLDPDMVRRKGSRTKGPPPLPRTNQWIVTSGLPDEASLDAHLLALFRRVQPYADALETFLGKADADGVFAIWRNFTAGPEDEEILARPPGSDERLKRSPGQHPLLGFHMDAQLVAFAAQVGVGFDFDEYADQQD